MPFEADGYRFFGWGAYTNSDFDEAIEEENFELAEDTVLYAIWNKGYTDMFSGEDEIYLMARRARQSRFVPRRSGY